MVTYILSNGKIITDKNFNENSDEVVCICNSDTKNESYEKEITNIHKDTVIESKEKISLKIPIIEEECKILVKATIDKNDNKLILDYHSDSFVEFLKEKIAIYNDIDMYKICLLLFKHFSYIYNEDLLKIEQEVDKIFEKAVNYGQANNKEILKIKKSISLIKRCVTSYKFILTYLDDEFNNLDLYDKVLLILDNDLKLVENIESSLFSCIDIYNSEISNKMNKTMQLLTIITVFPLPLTILSAVFGMNFEKMPLINNGYGFTIIIIAALVLIFLEVSYFKGKKYL